MRTVYLLAYTLLLLLRFVWADEVSTSCEDIALHWELIGFSQGNLLVSKEPKTQVNLSLCI